MQKYRRQEIMRNSFPVDKKRLKATCWNELRIITTDDESHTHIRNNS